MNGQEINTETLMLSIPDDSGSFPINKPIVKSSEDAADNFSFIMECNSPYYDAMQQFKTTLRVVYKDNTNQSTGDIVFFGRVLIVGNQSIFHTRNITCEGSFNYFKDTQYEGKLDKYLNKITVAEYLDKVIANHNANAPEKAINKGSITITLPTEKEKYEPTSWTDTASLLSNMCSNYGGHMRVRYNGLTPYLDWYKYYARDLGDGLRPNVTVGKNILDISSDHRSNQIFTKLIPIGATNANGKVIYIDGYKYKDKNGATHTYSGKTFPVSFIRNIYTDNQLTDEFHNYTDYRDAESKYGSIYKTMSFSDADTQKKLWDYMVKWVKETYFGIAPSFTVKAIDMHCINYALPKILIGDCVDVNYYIVKNGVKQWEHKKLICTALQYDLFNPENNSYTFAYPSDLLEHNNNNRKKSSKDTTASAAAGRKAIPQPAKDVPWTWKNIGDIIGELTQYPDYDGTDAYLSYIANGELNLSGTFYDPEEIPEGDIPSNHKDLWFTGKIIGKITLPRKLIKYVVVSESRGVFACAVFTNPGLVARWYIKKSGTYQGTNPGLSTFEEIALLIEKDTDATYGGQANANQFRSNGAIDGSVKCYDPDETNDPEHNPDKVFTATIVGKFGSSTKTYVATSSEYGIFAYRHVGNYEPVAHWYQQGQGTVYDNMKPLISTSINGEFFTTTDGTPDGDKTIMFLPKAPTGVESVGEIRVGYDLTSSEDKWKVRLNVPIRYQEGTDASGNPKYVIKDGFVSASDFNIEEIPSFKTKIGVFDEVITGVIQTGLLDAGNILSDLAYIRELNSDVVTADTRIASASGIINSLVSTTITSGTYVHTHYDMGSLITRHLEKCFYSFLFTESEGRITLTQYSADGTREISDSFNMAATTFYQNAVAAARSSGRSDVYVNNISIDAGSSHTYNLKYSDGSGEHDTGATFTVTAGSGGGGEYTTDDLQIDSYYTNPLEPPADKPAENMRDKILDAVNNHEWFKFRVYLKGTSPLVSKTYKMKFP